MEGKRVGYLIEAPKALIAASQLPTIQGDCLSNVLGLY